jgi:hypothetical protein
MTLAILYHYSEANFCNQALALKFRPLSVPVASGASVSNRKMSVIAGCYANQGN